MICGFLKTSLIDYPGKIVSTVFFQGCNFRCPFCHNPDLVIPDRFSSEHITQEIILSHLIENKMYLDGICITGGEPTLSHELLDFMRNVKKEKFFIKLDTNGTNPDMLRNIISEGLVDYIAMDVKGPFAKYETIVGMKVDIAHIKESIEIIKKSGVMHEFRTTVIPVLHTHSDVIETVKQLCGCSNFSIQQFRGKNTLDKSYEKESSYSKTELEEIRKEIIAKGYASGCLLKGAD